MSSTYRALCLSHDPALVIAEPEWQDHESLIGALADPATHLPEHRTCALMGGRYSYPLVELYSPQPGRFGAPGEWLDVKWARILLAAYDAPPDPRLTAALKGVPSCWSFERLDRMRAEIGVSA